MKNILLVGKMNELMKDLNKNLSKYFYVQLGSENVETLSGMLKVVEPDLVIICLVGLYEGQDSIFQKFQNEYPFVPVLTIGTKEEWNRFSQYYTGNQFENMVRPVKQSEVYEAVCKKLGLENKKHSEEQNIRKRILVVDDNGTTLRNLKAMLETDYDISLAPSGAKAMTSIGRNRPDLILLDYEMPVCDGKQTLEMIRAEKDMKDIPVVFLTSVNDRAHIEAVLGLHPAGYLLKPPVKNILLETIGKIIG